MLRHLAIAGVLLVTACGGQDPEPELAPATTAPSMMTSAEAGSTGAPSGAASAAPTTATAPSPTQPADGQGVTGQQIDNAEGARQAGLDPRGVVRALRFEDVNGLNVVVLRVLGTDRDPSLRADHVLVEPAEGRSRSLREVRDSDEPCDADELAKFVSTDGPAAGPSVDVRDDDGDGRGEVRFAYILTCATGVDEKEMKLLVLEDGEKHILRGATGTASGDPEPEPEPRRWPQGSYERALTQFRELQTTYCAPEPGC